MVTPRRADAARRGREVPGGGGGTGLAGLLLERNPIGRRLVFSQSRKRVRARTGSHYPAPLRAIDAVETGLAEGMEAGLEAEADAVAELFEGPTARHLMGIYRQREAARRPPVETAGLEVRRLGVLGAGVMGGAIGEVAAWNGIDVRMKDVDLERVADGMAHAARIARAAEKRGKLSARERRDLVLRLMHDQDRITDDQYAAARGQELRVREMETRYELMGMKRARRASACAWSPFTQASKMSWICW